MKRVVIAVIVLTALGLGARVLYSQRNRTQVEVQAAGLSRGDVVDTVGATGTVQAVTTVQVGTQVSGNIQWLGADFNSIVRRGQEIARLDPSLFDAQLQQVQANLLQARANLTRARSDLDQRQVQLADARQKYGRAQELASRQLLAISELDSAKVAVDSALAALASQQATVTQVEAAVTQSEASVNQSRVNRDHTVIVAPIDGIVTQRNVDVGQTVAASMQAPTLFVIAADLGEMQVNANIDEADVGRIRPGQAVSFRVDAYPTDNFMGTVTQVRLQPVVVQNVTTYGAVITVPNRELKLKPGMTANVKIEVARRNNVLRIPNAALRFRPTEEVFAALNQAVPPDFNMMGGRGGARGGAARDQGPGAPGGASGQPVAVPAPPAPQGSSAPRAERPAPPVPSASAPPPDVRGGGSSAPPLEGRGGRGGPRPGGMGRGAGAGPPGGDAGGGFPGGGRGNPERMLERLKTMTAGEQQQFLARMKDRGVDTSGFEAAMAPTGPAARRAPAATQQAQTIDALFAPLPAVETRGRAWIYVDGQLKLVNLRLGVTDGTFTEVLNGDELSDTMQVATGVTGLAPTRSLPAQNNGNPLMPGGRGPGGGGNFGGGGRGGRG